MHPHTELLARSHAAGHLVCRTTSEWPAALRVLSPGSEGHQVKAKRQAQRGLKLDDLRIQFQQQAGL